MNVILNLLIFNSSKALQKCRVFFFEVKKHVTVERRYDVMESVHQKVPFHSPAAKVYVRGGAVFVRAR